MTPIGLLLTVVFCLAVIGLSRRFAGAAMVGAVLFVTQGQQVDLGGFNFMAIRFVEIAAFLRIVTRGELAAFRATLVDRLLIIYFVCYAFIVMIRTGGFDWYAIGLGVDACFVYFAFRVLVTNPGEFVQFLHDATVMLVVFALLMLEESVRGYNLFSIMGGVPETPVLREGRFRCQSSFGTAITAGSVGATFLPIYVGILFQQTRRLWAGIGILACITIVLASHSSGPLMAVFTVIVGWGCWFFRQRMRLVRWGILGVIVGLHMVMKQPVWFIFDRLSGIFGGDGWHRSNLIDQFVKHFSEWWLIGMDYLNTGDWAATRLPSGGTDVTNYYVSLGIGGGLITLVIYVFFLTKCFSFVGNALNSIRGYSPEGDGSEPLLWGCGTALTAHVVNTFAVIYWDQSFVIWYLHLALAMTMAQYYSNGVAEEASTEYVDLPLDESSSQSA